MLVHPPGMLLPVQWRQVLPRCQLVAPVADTYGKPASRGAGDWVSRARPSTLAVLCLLHSPLQLNPLL